MYKASRRRLTIVAFGVLFLVIGSVLLSGAVRVHAQGQTYYVATNGSDSNDGSLGNPFLTIQKCASVATAGDTCAIRAGTYHETVTPTNSGTAGNAITFEPYQGEQVTIDGADQVTGWTQYQGNIYQAHVSINPNLFANQVFVDGRMMVDARWPNGNLDPILPTRATSGYGSGWQQVNDPALTQPAGFWNGAVIHVWGYDSYAAQTGTVTSSAPGTLSFSGGNHACPYLCMTAGNRYYLSGVLNALDQPTEWFYDKNSSTLYLWTPDGNSPDTYTTEVKQRNNAFDLSGRSYITVRGLNIFAATVVTDSKSSNNLLDGLAARYISHTDTILPGSADFDFLQSHVADTGIQLNGSNNTIQNSDIGPSGGSGVVLTGSGQTVTNNLIHDINYTGTYSAAVSVNGDSQTVTHNTIYRVARDAIAGSGPTNTRIAYNDIFNASRLNRDSGALYFCCQTTMTNTSIDHNYIHDSQVNHFSTLAETYGFDAAGIYIDNSDNGVLIHHNVIWNAGSFGIILNGADVSNPGSQNNRIYNNTVAEGSWKSLSVCGCDFSGSQVSNNIFLNDSPSSLKNGTVSNNLTSGTDPKFVNQSQHDYHLQASSPAIDAGQVISGITDGYAGSAPDEGAYEYGGPDWTAGSSLDTGVIPMPVISTTPGVGQVTVSWEAVKNATGYKVSYGPQHDIYTNTIDAGNVTSYTVTGLTGGQPYYFSVSAYNSSQQSPTSADVLDFPQGGTRSATSTIYAGSYDATSFVVNYKTYVGYVNQGSDNSWLEYKSVDFGAGVTTFTATLGVPPSSAGKTVEVHLDSTSGPLISTLTLQKTSDNEADYNNFVQQSALVSGASGVHDVYLVFKGQGSSFLGLTNVESFTFGTASTRDAFSVIQAESFDAVSGDIKLVSSGNAIGYMDAGSWAEYKGVNFGAGVGSVLANVAVPASNAGQKIELRLDSPSGPLIGTLITQATADWDTYSQQRTAVSGASGTHDLYLVVPAGEGGAGNIDWFTFSARDAFTVTQAESFDAKAGDIQLVSSGTAIGHMDVGSWAEYKGVNFGAGATGLTANVAVPASNAGQKIELHLDSPTGPVIGTLTLQATADWDTYTQQSTSVSGASGIHDLYLTVPAGIGVGNVDWFQFSATA